MSKLREKIAGHLKAHRKATIIKVMGNITALIYPCSGDELANQLLALIRSEGYVRLVPVQRLPYTDEATGDDLGLDQIRIVKQMWKNGYRLVEIAEIANEKEA